MTNFEHYKEEIKYKVINGGLNDFLAEHTYNGTVTSYSITKWYLDEYVEPYKLTKLEKIILENINPKLIYIIKKEDNVSITESDKWQGLYTSYPFPDVKFDCLKIGEYYKIADILANCEVIE